MQVLCRSIQMIPDCIVCLPLLEHALDVLCMILDLLECTVLNLQETVSGFQPKADDLQYPEKLTAAQADQRDHGSASETVERDSGVQEQTANGNAGPSSTVSEVMNGFYFNPVCPKYDSIIMIITDCWLMYAAHTTSICGRPLQHKV